MNELKDNKPIENIIGEKDTKLSDAEDRIVEEEITYAELPKALKIRKMKRVQVWMAIMLSFSHSFGLALGCLF